MRSPTWNNSPSSPIRTGCPASAPSPRRSWAWCPPPPPRTAAGHPLAPGPTRCRRWPSTTARWWPTRRSRLVAKLSYTNIGFALAPKEFALSTLRDIYGAALGHQVDATNLQRVLARRGVITPTGTTAHPGRSGGRPAALYRFTDSRLRVTDEFAALRPPG